MRPDQYIGARSSFAGGRARLIFGVLAGAGALIALGMVLFGALVIIALLVWG